MSGLNSVVEDVVNENVNSGSMFTAWDVTQEVRSRGHRAKHIEVRDSVHDCYNRGIMGVAYTRTTITVATGTPWLYHRTVDDPMTYGSNSPGTVPVSTVPVLNGLVKTSNVGRLIGRSVDGRGTLSIPTTLLVKAGFKPKDKVFATASGNNVELTKADPNSRPNGVFAAYTVDNYNQIRVTQNFLQKVGLGGNSYDISESNDKVVVKLHV